jgi:histidinol-phosphate aminotransferase
MNPRARPNVLQMEAYRPGKPIEEVKRELGLDEVIKLASNENPLGPSPKAIEAMQAALTQVHLYPDGYAYELRAALADYYGMPPDWILIGNGSDEIIHYLGLAYLNPGDELMMGHPSFVRYEAAAYLNNAVLRQVPLDSDYRHDLHAMHQQINERTKLFFIANPNNPTGTLINQNELEGLLKSLPEHVILILDEAYFEYATHPDYPNGLDYVRQGYNVIVMRTFSKAYGLAGLRVGYSIGRPDLMDPLERVREPFNVNSLAQAAATAALQDQAHVQHTRELNRQSLEYLYNVCTRLGLRYIPSWANFLMIDGNRPGDELFRALLKRGIIVRSGEPLGMPNFIRVNTGTREQNEKFARALEEGLKI